MDRINDRRWHLTAFCCLRCGTNKVGKLWVASISLWTTFFTLTLPQPFHLYRSDRAHQENVQWRFLTVVYKLRASIALWFQCVNSAFLMHLCFHCVKTFFSSPLYRWNIAPIRHICHHTIACLCFGIRTGECLLQCADNLPRLLESFSLQHYPLLIIEYKQRNE